jgi:hypothetical protein
MPSGTLPASASTTHVEVAGFLYSVPHALIREQVDTRATTRTIEVFHRGTRVASHARRYGGPRHGTLPGQGLQPAQPARAARPLRPSPAPDILALPCAAPCGPSVTGLRHGSPPRLRGLPLAQQGQHRPQALAVDNFGRFRRRRREGRRHDRVERQANPKAARPLDRSSTPPPCRSSRGPPKPGGVSSQSCSGVSFEYCCYSAGQPDQSRRTSAKGCHCHRAADAFAANVVPIVRQIEASGVKGSRAIAAAMNARGVRTARGGEWHATTVRNLLTR